MATLNLEPAISTRYHIERVLDARRVRAAALFCSWVKEPRREAGPVERVMYCVGDCVTVPGVYRNDRISDALMNYITNGVGAPCEKTCGCDPIASR